MNVWFITKCSLLTDVFGDAWWLSFWREQVTYVSCRQKDMNIRLVEHVVTSFQTKLVAGEGEFNDDGDGDGDDDDGDDNDDDYDGDDAVAADTAADDTNVGDADGEEGEEGDCNND